MNRFKIEKSDQRRGIIAAGTWTVDRVKLVDGWPRQEHLALILESDQQGGGSAHNLGVDTRKLDPVLPVEAIGLIGTDADADFLLDRCHAVGINTDQLRKSDQSPTSYTDVISDSETGRRTFFHYSGTSNLLHPGHFDLSACRGAWMHLGLVGVHALMDSSCTHDGQRFENGWVAVLQQAQQLGIRCNLELVSIAEERIREIALPCLDYLDSLIVNEFEAGALAGITITDSAGLVDADRCVEAAEKLHTLGDLSLVVIHFPQGAVAVTSSGLVSHRKSFELDANRIGSAVGAGDAFAAGVLYGLHEYWPLDDALELGHAVAAASLRSTNTVDSVETVDQCLAFARSL